MVSILYKKHNLLRIRHNWFYPSITHSKEVFTFYHGIDLNKAEIKKNYIISKQYTLLSNLELTEDELFKIISKNSRYEIKKAGRSEIKHNIYDGIDFIKMNCLIKNFIEMYNQMYISKGIDTRLNIGLFKSYIKNNCITVSMALYKDNPIVYHVYVRDELNTRLLYSASSFRNDDMDSNIVSIANKYLHWNDICYFKKQGVRVFDWGGVSDIDNPNGIDFFKMRFGGEPKAYYNIIVCRGLLGYLYILRNKNRN